MRNFLKWLILESLPNSFDMVKLTYNALNKEWTLEKLTLIEVHVVKFLFAIISLG